MPSLPRALARLRQLGDSSRALAVLSTIFLLASAVFLYTAFRTDQVSIRISAGDQRGRRAEVARALRVEAERRGITIELLPSAGSEEALARVQRRELDAALVQGGLESAPDVREVAALTLEPLHLLVRSGSEIYDLEDLRGCRVNLAPPRSGTRRLALDVMHLARLRPERDFEETAFGYQELEEMEPAQLPDAIFHVSSMPSPVARFLVTQRGYRLLPLPMASAIALRNVAVSPGTIPAYTYGAAPPTPREDVPTLATRMLLVAHRDTSDEVVRRLLEAMSTDDFGTMARVHRGDLAALLERPEMQLHPGTVEWLRRNDPLLTPELMEGIESFRSFLVSLVVAAFLGLRWWRRTRMQGLDQHMITVSRIDREALELEREARLDLAKLIALRTRLGEAKTLALDAFSRGKVHSDELLSSFLTHVSDVRSHLNAMILHERDRLEKTARAQGKDEESALRELWDDALAEELADRVPREPPTRGTKRS
ncbi:MAG: TAXI family TRAP transporter solute-binding subunit [Myxococcota bacterium]|nr:TAXI family TRAP transporter solute-binding subunit [Myxococcota bacterium]